MSTASLRMKCGAAVLVMLAWNMSAAGADVWYESTGAKTGTPAKNVAVQLPTVVIAENSATALRFSVVTPGVAISSFKTADETFTVVGWPDAAISGDVGSPAIPVVRRLIVVPPDCDVTATVVSAAAPRVLDEKTVGAALFLAPVRAPIPKLPGAAAAARYLMDGAVYSVNADMPATRVTLVEAGIVRGARLMLVEVHPVAYNPAARLLSIYAEIEVEIAFNAPALLVNPPPLTRGLDRFVLNPPDMAQPRDPGWNYFIVVAGAFSSDISDFASAKIAQGYKVRTWTAAAGATAAQIKAQIASEYAVPEFRPDYVLLVGDTNTIPHWIGGGEGSPPTDLPYTCMDGTTDWFPDIAIGRFPVRTSAQLTQVVAKTLYFQNGPLADPSYLSRAVFMASEDNYSITEGTHEYCISNYMDPFNIEADRLYSHTYSATTQEVRDAFNNGRIYGIYSGHGGEFMWADGPVFTQADVNGLFNFGMYPFVCSFACVTGDFTQTECFSETWMLAPAKGAAAIWASSVNSYWTEDDVLQRTMFSVFFDDYLRELGPAFNQTRARYAVQMGTGQTTRRYFEMYNLMGDPSLAIAEAEAALRVSPSGAVRMAGPEGGPFSPSSVEFMLRNVSDIPTDYEVTSTDWLVVDGVASGTLLPGASAPVTISIGPAAVQLPIGLHNATAFFTNTTNHIGDANRTFSLEVGRYAFDSIDVPKTISDNSTVSSVISVGEHVCIADVNVDINITHTYIGDLLVRLQSPKGTSVTLHNRSGGSTDNIVLTYDDEGTAPDGPGALADFIRESAFGTWTLTASDLAGGDQGTLNGWTLRMLPMGEVCPPVAQSFATTTLTNLPVAIELQGSTDGGGPLMYMIASLPSHGVIQDVETGLLISGVPYELLNYGRQIRYRAENSYIGSDQFTYRVYDDTGVSDQATVSIDVGGLQLIHSFPLDVNPGWSVTGQWQFGQPQGLGSQNPDPTSGYSGLNVYGYNLSGDYSNNMASTMYLTTTAMNLQMATGVQLRFRRWLGIESASYDHANIQVSNNGSSWTTVWDHTGGSLSETQWSLQTYDISQTADGRPTVFVRWGMGPTDSSVTYSGWNIDDIELWGIVPGPVLGDLNCDGVSDLNDVGAFVMTLLDRDAYQATYPNCLADLADANGDLSIDGADVDEFLHILTGP